jgi:hypothetical protein
MGRQKWGLSDMTWVVGMPLNLGVAIGISDVRVTAADGSTKDCLQKIYPVGNFIALAFAGSVSIGFRMVDRLAALLVGPSENAWDPEIVAEWWPADAREVFEASSCAEQAGHSHLMMISAHPNKRMGDAPWHHTYVHIFRSPTFEPEPVAFNVAGSIGYGAYESGCIDALERLTTGEDEKFGLLQSLIAGQAVPGLVLGHALSEYIREASPGGISPHLNLCTAVPGQIVIANNDYVRHGPDGAGNFVMPKLARSMAELVEIMKAQGATAEGAKC